MQTIQLQDYQVNVGPIETSIKEYLDGRSYTHVVVIVDENTAVHCLPKISGLIGEHMVVEIPSGEQNKTLTTCEAIWQAMVDCEMDRHGLVINLGGGVIGDMGGFAASCYMRGVDFVQIPTTLLSQVDASVGGKLAVDFNGLKNFIGLFQNPKAVLVDPSFLKTLIPAELRSGYAEMVKHALIQDADIWKRLTAMSAWQDNANLEEIYQSIKVKEKVVLHDPKEGGLRKILNYGHTVGHAIETLSFETERPYLHGEAIAMGMVAEAYLSQLHTGLAVDQLQEIVDYFLAVYPGLSTEVLKRYDAVIDILKRDKKNKGGKYMFSLLKSIGDCTYDIEVDDADLRASLDYVFEVWS